MSEVKLIFVYIYISLREEAETPVKFFEISRNNVRRSDHSQDVPINN